VGPSGPDFINLDNINGSDDPESTMPPQITDRCDDSTRDRSGISRNKCMPNPLSEFINIYSDDESPEASLGTPVHVQEEKGPEKTSSPDPEVQTQEVPQKEKKPKVFLDTKRPDAPETQADNPKDKSEPMSQRKDPHKRKSTFQRPMNK
jgi:hypothetical protein